MNMQFKNIYDEMMELLQQNDRLRYNSSNVPKPV